MVAEWIMGVYPLLQTWGHETADHLTLQVPIELRALLERALAPTLAERPRLAAFIDQLAS